MTTQAYEPHTFYLDRRTIDDALIDAIAGLEPALTGELLVEDLLKITCATPRATVIVAALTDAGAVEPDEDTQEPVPLLEAGLHPPASISDLPAPPEQRSHPTPVAPESPGHRRTTCEVCGKPLSASQRSVCSKGCMNKRYRDRVTAGAQPKKRAKQSPPPPPKPEPQKAPADDLDVDPDADRYLDIASGEFYTEKEIFFRVRSGEFEIGRRFRLPEKGLFTAWQIGSSIRLAPISEI